MINDNNKRSAGPRTGTQGQITGGEPAIGTNSTASDDAGRTPKDVMDVDDR